MLREKETIRSYSTDFNLIILGVMVLLFLSYNFFKGDNPFLTVPAEWVNANTIFLSIVIEAIPFILLGVFVSALIQVYVKEEVIQKYLPKNAFAALIPATALAALFPICECAIVLVVRRLIKKGMPLHIGVIFLVAAPILNPIVALSTFYAFRTDLTVLYLRMSLAFGLAVIIGGIFYIIFKNSKQLKEESTVPVVHTHHSHKEAKQSKFKQTFFHAADEFFDMGKFLIIGAFFAAIFQTFMDRQLLLDIGSNEYSSTIVMMAFAYVLSLCSEADAFVASSFGSTFSVGSIIAFLVYGPMIDLKNTIMLFAVFKARFVITFISVVTVVVFLAVLIVQFTVI
ncbi:permease [Bacillus shivajii]|uniref:permease n=1 Tax=Bacillus shivajii TaxID=1983719 RepID=UPI001CFAF19F|nr:permease [Bacillus shivajii]UCZ53117.1 permease [Bacillus shivajii]